MKFSLLFLSLLFSSFFSLTHASDLKIYRWIDDNGNVHFSDTSTPGTEEFEAKDYTLLTSKEATTESQPAIIENDNQEIEVRYTATILSPSDDKAVRSNDGTINVNVSIEPKKDNDQTLQLYLDGKKLGEPHVSTTIRARNIDRGTHQLQVKLLDKDGKQLAKTQIVTVHLLRVTN